MLSAALTEEDMKRHRSPYILVATAGVAALALSAAGCSSSAEKPGGMIGQGIDGLVFAKRMHTTVGDDGRVQINIGGGTGQVIDYGRYVPGGGVYLLSPARQDGTLTNLTKNFPSADIAGLDLSFDAQEVVYSMKKSGDDHYHIYTQRLDSETPSQRTFGEADDINPIYAPGERIVFVTNEAFTEMGTRADEYNHGRVVTQLATITRDGGDADRKLCSQNLSHTVNPFLRYDGSIGYSRWEHLGPINDVKLFRMAPDCTQMIHVAGQFGKPSNSLVQVTEVSPNVMVGVATDRERTIQAGSLVAIDSRFYKDGKAVENKLDSEHVKYEALTPAVPMGSDQSPMGRYRTPHGLPDGRLVVSWADGVVNDTNELTETPPDFGIYVFDPKGNPEKPNLLVYNDKNAWELYPIPVVARAVPPVIGSVQNVVDATLPSTFGSLDVRVTDLNDDNVTTVQHYMGSGTDSSQGLPAALRGAVRVRVIEGFSSEAAPGVTMFGLTMDEGAAVLGEATVYGDGSWLANIPPYIPVHLQPVDKFGLSIRNQRLWVQGMPGEARVCGGCHESRTGDNDLGTNQNLTVAAAQGPQNLVKPVAERQEYPWDGAPAGTATVQQFLTAKCATCHNDTQNGSKPQTFYTVSRTDRTTGEVTPYQIPYLSFSATPIAVYYDGEVRPWASSYVSIFYPAAMEMEMDGLAVMGEIPPKWGIPESARESVLIEKLNVKGPDGSFAWDPATHPSHPEDVGVTITDEERQMLIRVMDLGGQYYARKNTGYAPYGNDPTSRNK
jgi:hypothetical protein